MKKVLLAIFVTVSTMIVGACDKLTQTDTSPPVITAQGFEIETTQLGKVSEYGSLRVRVESPAGIDHLQIKERSYDIDLATTPEREHFQLFGLDRRVRLSKDITLDFQKYINQKLQQPGEYTFTIEVTDKQQQTQTARLAVRLTSSAAEPVTEPEESAPAEQSLLGSEPASSMSIKTGQFEIQRIGPREIGGEKTFGLAWKTVDALHVTIRVRKKESGASKLASLTAYDYAKVETQDGLKQLLLSAQDQDYVDFNTANSAAAGIVLGVINLGKPYLLKSTQSATSLSDTGTTVTLNGDYKY
jgi:hypothetical protein